jgi:hypothetical protein
MMERLTPQAIVPALGGTARAGAILRVPVVATDAHGAWFVPLLLMERVAAETNTAPYHLRYRHA